MGRQLPYEVSQVSTYAWAPVKTSGDDRGRRGCSENVREKTKLLLPLCRVRLVPARSGRMGYGSPLGTTKPSKTGHVPTLGEMQSLKATADGVNQARTRRLPCEIRVVVSDVLHDHVGLWTDG